MRMRSIFIRSTGCLLAGWCCLDTLAAQVIAQPLITARSSLPAGSLPPASTSDGQFELLSIGSGQFQRNPSWGQWTFDQLSGIAHESSALAGGNPPAPSGDRVAYLAAQGQVTVTANLSAGAWRLRYQLAGRNQGGVIDAQTVRIAVNGQLVAHEQELNSSYRQYTTRAFQVAAGAHQITFTGTGSIADIALFDNVVLESLRDWSVASNWSPAVVPGAGNQVVIPSGSAITITSNSVAGDVTLDGELLVPDGTGSLTAASVLVKGVNAHFEVGRREVPFAPGAAFKLILTGPFTASNSKFLMARNGGTIDLHGATKNNWTQLTATANVGSLSIQVADATGWHVGDEIVIAGSEGQALPGIASTGFAHYSERRSVRAINGNTIDLGQVGAPSMPQALVYKHISSSQSYPTAGPSNWMLEQHAEVGMLTHNVKVTSVPVPVPGTSGNPETGFGGHIMIMGTVDGDVGRGRFSAVELTKMGQTKQLGRYPIHWHMCRDAAAGQYVVDCSMHETFNRAVTVHGTDGILVEGNVGYRNLGHAFFLEDGSEQDNVLRRNLAIATLKPVMGDQLLPSDNELDGFQNRTPAAFWITNPQNTIVGNVASDTIGTGFWLIFPQQVLGLSNPATPNAIPHNYTVPPNTLDLIEFRDNVAHGCRQGFDVHDGIEFGTDHIRTNLSWAPASGAAWIENFTAYGCDSAIYTGDGDSGGDIVFDHAMLADDIIGTRFASGDIVQDSLFVADSGNGLYTTRPVQAVGKELEAYRFYDGAPLVTDSHFDGYHIQGTSRLFGSNGASLRRTNHRFVNVTFEPPVATGQPRVVFEDFSANPGGGTGMSSNAQSPADPRSWGFSGWDANGALTGSVGSIIGNHPWMLDGNEVPYVNGINDPSNAFFTPQKFGHLYVREPGVGGPGLPEITFTRLKSGLSPAQFINDYTVDQQKQVPVIVNDGFLYSLDWTNVNGSPTNGLPTSGGADELRLRVGNLDVDDAVILLLQLQQPGVTVTIGGAPVAATTNLALLRQQPPGGSSLLFLDANGNLYLRVMNPPVGQFFLINW